MDTCIVVRGTCAISRRCHRHLMTLLLPPHPRFWPAQTPAGTRGGRGGPILRRDCGAARVKALHTARGERGGGELGALSLLVCLQQGRWGVARWVTDDDGKASSHSLDKLGAGPVRSSTHAARAPWGGCVAGGAEEEQVLKVLAGAAHRRSNKQMRSASGGCSFLDGRPLSREAIAREGRKAWPRPPGGVTHSVVAGASLLEAQQADVVHLSGVSDEQAHTRGQSLSCVRADAASLLCVWQTRPLHERLRQAGRRYSPTAGSPGRCCRCAR